MAVLNIEKSFLTENRSVLDFLSQPGQGLYIPLYQREYSWDSDNIEQLLEDLTGGVRRLASGEYTTNTDNKEIRFLGTIITVIEANRNNIYPRDPQAIPSKIEKLIDGQQRVSTIALMATLLTKRFYEIKKKVKATNPIYNDVDEICDYWTKKLLAIYSFDLGRGTPPRKPKIIRGAKDYWTREHSIDDAYKSELSNYLARFIDAELCEGQKSYPVLSKEKFGNSFLYQNSRDIEKWLKRVTPDCEEDVFASPINIIENISQEFLWDYGRDSLVNLVKQQDYSRSNTDSYILSELVQLAAICHYLLDRCCFTIIQPTDDDWAFDMFQSLNATGTPLTAIETFKPTIVNTVNDELEHQFKDSPSDIYFKKLEIFLSETATAQQKNKRTNDYITSFFVALDGSTVSTHFSYQRKILNKAYTDLTSFEEKEYFVKRMGNYAEFYRNWLKYDGKEDAIFPAINSSHEADLASMLIKFLIASNHKMAITVLGRMYYSVIEQTPNSVDSFISIVKAIAAYYFLWRSAYSNSGLDSTYRDFFKKNKKNEQFSAEIVCRHLKEVLKDKKIDTLDSWKSKAKNYLKYDSATGATTGRDVLRLAILIAAHDTIPDKENRGMIKEGRENISKYLCLEKWISPDLKTIEHVAPQSKNDGQWEDALYDPHFEPYQSLGNLTLLPQSLNSSAGNKEWREKLLYYQCVAEKDPEKIENIEKTASDMGIELNTNTINLLKESHFNEHLSSISSMSADDVWNRELVDKRTDIMLDIIWNRVSKWIF
ncbi:MAG: DUF262 domain-containing protein [Bacteroidales bacterium]|nr:DUF262 domain-containing protein [Bacteroidales bacterium]